MHNIKWKRQQTSKYQGEKMKEVTISWKPKEVSISIEHEEGTILISSCWRWCICNWKHKLKKQSKCKNEEAKQNTNIWKQTWKSKKTKWMRKQLCAESHEISIQNECTWPPPTGPSIYSLSYQQLPSAFWWWWASRVAQNMNIQEEPWTFDSSIVQCGFVFRQ